MKIFQGDELPQPKSMLLVSMHAPRLDKSLTSPILSSVDSCSNPSSPDSLVNKM